MKYLLLAILSLSASSAFALGVESVSITGPDCDSSNTSVVFSPDNATFSILYGSMETTSQGGPRDYDMGKAIAPQRRCKITIAYRPAAGKQVELQQIDYRGFVSAPTDKSYGIIESKHRFLGGSIAMGTGRSPSEHLNSGVFIIKQGPYQDDFSWSARFSPTSHFPNLGMHISNCTGKADLVIDTNVRGHSFDIEQDVSVVLDSADARLGGQAAVYKVVENKCDKINQARDRVCRNRVCPN